MSAAEVSVAWMLIDSRGHLGRDNAVYVLNEGSPMPSCCCRVAAAELLLPSARDDLRGIAESPREAPAAVLEARLCLFLHAAPISCTDNECFAPKK